MSGRLKGDAAGVPAFDLRRLACVVRRFVADRFDLQRTAVTPAGPLRVTRLAAQAGSDHVQVWADLEPVCPPEEWIWWEKQLRPGVRLSGFLRSRAGINRIAIRVPHDDVERAARRLLAALDAAAAGYPENFLTWRRERDEEQASDKRRQDESSASYQGILDTVMEEYRSGSGTQT